MVRFGWLKPPRTAQVLKGCSAALHETAAYTCCENNI
jgi:hypothetical protein